MTIKSDPIPKIRTTRIGDTMIRVMFAGYLLACRLHNLPNAFGRLGHTEKFLIWFRHKPYKEISAHWTCAVIGVSNRV